MTHGRDGDKLSGERNEGGLCVGDRRVGAWLSRLAVVAVVASCVNCGTSSDVSRSSEERVVARLKALGVWADMYAYEYLRVDDEKQWRLPDTFDVVSERYKGAGQLEMPLPDEGVARFTYVGRGLTVDDKGELVFVCDADESGDRFGVTVGGSVRRLSEVEYGRALASADVR